MGRGVIRFNSVPSKRKLYGDKDFFLFPIYFGKNSIQTVRFLHGGMKFMIPPILMKYQSFLNMAIIQIHLFLRVLKMAQL